MSPKWCALSVQQCNVFKREVLPNLSLLFSTDWLLNCTCWFWVWIGPIATAKSLFRRVIEGKELLAFRWIFLRLPLIY